MVSTSPSTPAIRLRELSKTYTVHEREPGVMAALKSLVHRNWRDIQAVDRVTFDVAPGEIVGFLGPNGAGKTTTIKMLSGLLYPTGGEVEVLGYVPSRRHKKFLKQITLAMGRRNQLVWDVPAIESFEFFRAIYDIPPQVYREMLGELTALMGLEPLLRKPVRNLSLGERMKCELAAALLHRPVLLLLDEPTIGLDLLAQSHFREYIAEYNQRYGATVLITSHYVGDVEELCRRVIFIDEARIVYDGPLQELADRCLPYKHIVLRSSNGTLDVGRFGEVVERTDGRVSIQVAKNDLVSVTRALVNDGGIQDFTISDPPIGDVIKHVYAHGAQQAENGHAPERAWRPRD